MNPLAYREEAKEKIYASRSKESEEIYERIRERESEKIYENIFKEIKVGVKTEV